MTSDFTELSFLTLSVSSQPLVLFRWCLGLIQAVYWIVNFRKAVHYYSSSPFYIPYEWTRWIKPPGKRGIQFVLGALIISSLLLAFGYWHPYPAWSCLLLYFYVFLWDRSLYNNHYYLICVFYFLMGLTNLDQTWIPYWQLGMFQFQFFIVYTFGAINKIQKDWLKRAQPTWHTLRHFEGTTRPSLFLHRYCPTPFSAMAARFVLCRKSTAYFLNYTGLLFDLTIIPLLWFDITRFWAIPFFIGFHLFNQWWLYIEVFPILNLAALVLFLDIGPSPSTLLPQNPSNTTELLILTAFIAIQILLPLRRLVRALLFQRDLMSDHRWFFSWTMRLRASTGTTVFRVVDRHSNEVLARVQASQFLSPRQAACVDRSPHAAILFAKWLEGRLEQMGWKNFGIFVACHININERGPRLMIDPEVDFTQEKVRYFGSYSWYKDQRPKADHVPV